MHAKDISRATNRALIGNELTLTLPPTALEVIARRVVEILTTEGRLPEAAPVSEYLNVEEAAEYLRCDKQRIYDLVSSRRLDRYKDGSRVLLKRSELDTYLSSYSKLTEKQVASALPPASQTRMNGRAS